MTDPTTTVDRSTKIIRWASRILVGLVALAAAVLSFVSLYEYAVPTFGPVLAVGFPLIVDLLIFGALASYVSSCRDGTPRYAWRLAAHGGVIGTVVLNGLAAPTPADVPLHIAAPIVWSLLIELVARDATFAGNPPPPIRIPWTLWATAPIESFLSLVTLSRQSGHTQARLDVGRAAAARESLRLALPGLRSWPTRAVLRRMLRAGVLTPEALVARMSPIDSTDARTPRRVLRTVLRDVLAPEPEAVPPDSEPERVSLPAPAETGTPVLTDYTTLLTPRGPVEPSGGFTPGPNPRRVRSPRHQAARDMSTIDSHAVVNGYDHGRLAGLEPLDAARYAARHATIRSAVQLRDWLAAQNYDVSRDESYDLWRVVKAESNGHAPAEYGTHPPT